MKGFGCRDGKTIVITEEDLFFRSFSYILTGVFFLYLEESPGLSKLIFFRISQSSTNGNPESGVQFANPIPIYQFCPL